MDIRGLGPERVSQLVATGLVKDVSDLYFVRVDQILELDRFAKQSAEQLVQAIAASREKPLSNLLFAIGIRHVGANVATLLARRFGTMDALKSATRNDINAVPGIGPAIADAVASFFHEESNVRLVNRMAEAGLNLIERGPEILDLSDMRP